MKNYRSFNLIAIILFVLSIFGCSDKKENIPVSVTLSANKTTIKANGKDSLTFTVKVDGKETVEGVVIVPSSSTSTEGLNQFNFATSKTGTYSFYALYDGQKSNEITVTATQVVIKLITDKANLKPNGTDIIRFTVKADDEDVTSLAVITLKGENETKLESHSFSTEKSGIYTFYATYNGEQSEKITIRSATEAVTLTLSKSEIKANGSEETVFTVFADGKDVTGKAVIMQKGSLDTVYDVKTFKTTEPETYTFYAVYDNVKSDEVSLKATYVPLSFIKQFCIIQFASAACNTCPIMTQAINDVRKQRPNRIVPIVLHVQNRCINYETLYGVLGKTADMLCPSWPSSLVDLNQKVNIYPTSTPQKLISAIDYMNAFCPSQTGIAMESKVTDGTIQFTANILTNKTDRYHFYAFVVEDGIRHGQMITREEVDLNYVHNHVATYKLSDDDPRTGIDWGEIRTGKKASRTFTIDTKPIKLKRTVNLNNCRIVAYTLRTVNGVHCIDNVTSCPVNGTVDYKYSK